MNNKINDKVITGNLKTKYNESESEVNDNTTNTWAAWRLTPSNKQK